MNSLRVGSRTRDCGASDELFNFKYLNLIRSLSNALPPRHQVNDRLSASAQNQHVEEKVVEMEDERNKQWKQGACIWTFK